MTGITSPSGFVLPQRQRLQAIKKATGKPYRLNYRSADATTVILLAKTPLGAMTIPVTIARMASRVTPAIFASLMSLPFRASAVPGFEEPECAAARVVY